MNNLTKEQIKALIMALVSLICGVLFCVLRVEMLGALETIACMALLLYGVIEVVIYCVVSTDSRDASTLLKGAVSTGFALLIIFVGAVFVVVLGLIIVLSGVVYIRSSIFDKKKNESGWLLAFIIGVLLVCSGLTVAVLYNTKLAREIVMMIFGITLIFDGVVRLVYVFLAHKSLYLDFSKINVKEETLNTENADEQPVESEKDDNIEVDFTVTKVENDNKKEKKKKIKEKHDKKIKKESKNEGGFDDFDSETKFDDDSDDADDTEGFV